jgi:hypothetical protein
MKFAVFGLTSLQFYSELCAYYTIYNIKNVTFKFYSTRKLSRLSSFFGPAVRTHVPYLSVRDFPHKFCSYDLKFPTSKSRNESNGIIRKCCLQIQRFADIRGSLLY